MRRTRRQIRQKNQKVTPSLNPDFRQSRRSRKFVRRVLAVLLALGSFPLTGSVGTLAVGTLAVGPAAAQADDFNVLVVGNSFTQTNGNLNEFLGAMLKSDTSFAGGYDSINLLKTSVNGQTLLYHSGTGTATYSAITSATPYDCIILQEYSTGTQPTNLTATQNINNMVKGGTSLYRTIQGSASADAQILLYQTWERPGTINLETIQAGYGVLASTINSLSRTASGTDAATVVGVGTSWMDVKNLTGKNLYHTDNYHQNYLGTYLNALKFYSQVTGKTNVEGVYQTLAGNSEYAFITSNVTAADALLVEKVVSGTLTYASTQTQTLSGTQNLGSPTFQGVSAVSSEGVTSSVYFVNASGSDTKLTAGTFNLTYDAFMTLEDGASLNCTSTGWSFTRIGDNGTGVMNVFSGSKFDAATHVIVGRRTGASGYLNLDGAGTSSTINSMLYLGGWSDGDAAANGFVTVTDGASLKASGITIGRSSGSVSSMTVNHASVSTQNSGSFNWNTSEVRSGADWLGNLWVGANGRGVLNVQQGGVVTVANDLFGGISGITAANAASSSTGNRIAMSGNGLLLVQGGNAILSNTTVSLADSGRILIGNGVTAGSVSSSVGLYVGAGNDRSGTLTLKGSTISGSIFIGSGSNASGTNGTVNATGSNTIAGTVHVGSSTSGKLDVQSGTTTIRSADINLGNSSTSGEIVVREGATLNVLGSSDGASSWVRVGGNGTASSPASGTLTVYGTYRLGSDSFTGFSGTVLGRWAESTGTLLVSGQNAVFESLVPAGNVTSVGLGVGGYDGGSASTNARGFATFEKGATGRISTLNIGNYGSAEGTMTVDASTVSVLQPTGSTAFGFAVVGAKGKGTLTVRNGSTFSTATTLTIGSTASGTGEMTLDGSTAAIGTGITAGTVALTVGGAGKGTLNLTNAAALTTPTLTIGSSSGSTGTMGITNSSATVSGNLVLGGSGKGSLTVSNSSTASNSLKVTGSTLIGNAAGSEGSKLTINSGKVTMNSVSVGLNASADVVLNGGSWNTQEVNLANGSSSVSGSVTINDGAAWNVSSALYVRIGRNGTGTLTINEGGTYSGAGTHLIIGRNVKGTLAMAGGTANVKTLYVAGWEDGNSPIGLVNLNSGATLTGSGLNVAASAKASGTVNLGTAANDTARSTVTFTGASGTETAESQSGWKVYPKAAIIGAEGTGTLNVFNADVTFGKSIEIGHHAQFTNAGGVSTLVGTGSLNAYDAAKIAVTGDVEISAGSSLNFILSEMGMTPLLTVSGAITQENSSARVTVSGRLASIGQSLMTDRRPIFTTANAFAGEIGVSDSWNEWLVDGNTVYAVLNTSNVNGAEFGAMKTIRDSGSVGDEYDLTLEVTGHTDDFQSFMETLQAGIQQTDSNATVSSTGTNSITISNLDFNPDGIGLFAWNLADFNAATGSNLAFTQLPEPATWSLMLLGLGLGLGLRRRTQREI